MFVILRLFYLGRGIIRNMPYVLGKKISQIFREMLSHDPNILPLLGKCHENSGVSEMKFMRCNQKLTQ